MLLDDIDALSSHLARRYGAGAVTLRPLVRGSGKDLYRVERPDQPAWLMRVASSQASAEAFFNDAAVLTLLAHHAYPAPRVIPALDGTTVTAYESRPILVTTFIEGVPTTFSPADLGRVGEALGHLHALPFPAATSAGPDGPCVFPSAGMLPRAELAAARSWLAEVHDALSPRYRARHDRLVVACHDLDLLEDLPTVLIHNDCHPGNSIQTPDGRAVLIDWEGAGQGPAIVDVGFLLVSCEIEAFRSNRLPFDHNRMAAVIDGYCRHHRPTPRELERLPDAIRFRAVVACAGGLWNMVREGRTSDDADWAWARYTAATESPPAPGNSSRGTPSQDGRPIPDPKDS